MHLRNTTERIETAVLARPTVKVEGASGHSKPITPASSRWTNFLLPAIAFMRRIPKRWLVATLFVAVYRGMCGYQMSFIGTIYLRRRSHFQIAHQIHSLTCFREYHVVIASWFMPDTSPTPHIAFAVIVFLDTIAATILGWWLMLKLPLLLWRKYPWRGRNFRH